MRTAVIGAYGQLGSDLIPVLSGEVIPLGRNDLDVADFDSVARCLDEQGPDVVINCAAYNFVDRAEQEPEVACAANALGPRNVARWCAANSATLLHVSSDYVFGSDQPRDHPYREDDRPQPRGAYAISKLAGEYFVQGEVANHYVVRTCGLYGRKTATKGNFVETMLRLGTDRDELTVVDDQRCTPTATADLAQAIAALIPTNKFGLYHATNSGSMTWCEFAREIFRQADVQVEVKPISTTQFGAPAPRPRYSVLDCNKLAGVIGDELPDWHDALAQYLDGRC